MTVDRAARWRQRLQESEGLILAVAVSLLILSLVYWRVLAIHRAPYRLVQDVAPAPAWSDTLYGLRWGVRAVMAASGGALLAVEVMTRGVTRRLRAILSRPLPTIAFLTVMTLIGRSYLLTPGHLAYVDGLANVANVLAIRVALQQGNFPPYYWSNFAWMGSPWLQFHNSAFYYEGALIDLVLHDAFLSTKVALLINHVLATVAILYYVRHLARSAWAGLVSAAVWASSFFQYQYFVHAGAAHLSALLPLVPFSLLCAERVIERQRTRQAAAALALMMCLMLWAHPYYGLVTAGLIVLYAVARLVLGRARAFGRRLIPVGWIVASLALGALAAISQWLPPALESNLVGGGNQSARFPLPFLRWEQVLSFRGSYLAPEWWGGYVGLTVFGLAMLGVALVPLTRNARAGGLIAWLLATAYLSVWIGSLPFSVLTSQLPFGIGNWVIIVAAQRKYLMFFELALAGLAGLAIRELSIVVFALRRWWRGRTDLSPMIGPWLALLAVLVVSGEMIYSTLQVNSFYPESWVGLEPGRGEYLDWLKAHGDRTSRLLDTYLGNLEASALSGQPSFVSHYEEQPPSGGTTYALMDAVRQDAKMGTLRRSTRDELYLRDVGYVVLDQSAPPDSGWRLAWDGGVYDLWRVGHSPVVAAPRLQANSTASPTLIEAMHVDQTRNTAAFIPVGNLPAGEGQGVLSPGDKTLRLTAHDYDVGLKTVLLDYELSGPAYIQLSYSAYPNFYLYLDGERREYFSTAFQLIGFQSLAGKHRLELRPVLSPLRVVSYWLDGLGLAAIALLAGWNKVKSAWRTRR